MDMSHYVPINILGSSWLSLFLNKIIPSPVQFRYEELKYLLSTSSNRIITIMLKNNLLPQTSVKSFKDRLSFSQLI